MSREGRRRLSRRAAQCAALLIPILLAGVTGHAQTTSAALTGTVLMPDGSAAPGALVVARSEATGVERAAVAGFEGRYRIDLLKPGSWTVVARLGEAMVSQSRTVALALQQTLRLDLAVASAISEHVTVKAEPPLVDPERPLGEFHIEHAQINVLPLDGRDYTDLALLDSAARPPLDGGFLGEREPVLIVNGQSPRSNSFLVDGLDNNDLASGMSLNAAFSQQVIREFVLMRNQFAAEFGRASGAILNIVTEQGGNEPSAGVFVQGVNRQLNEPGEFVDSLPPQDDLEDTGSRLQAGFNFGGPLKRDRAFYFFAFEHKNDERVLPYTGIDRDGVAGGYALLPDESNSLFFRTDFNLSDTQFMMLRLSGDHRDTEGLNVGGTRTPESGFRLKEQDLQFAWSLASILTADVMNEARFLAGTSSFDQLAASARPGVERPSGTFGGDDLNRQERDEDRFQFIDNLTWTHDRHSLKFGVDVLRSRTGVATLFNPNGNFLYQTDAQFEPGDRGDLIISQLPRDAQGNLVVPTPPIPNPGMDGVDDDGDGIIDEPGLIQTYPFVFQLIDGAPTDTMYDTSLALFAQNSYQAGLRWRLDYGLRYDLSTYTLPASAAVQSSIPNGGAGRDTDNVAPRFGFAFTPQPDAGFVLRGGAGMFYDRRVLAFPAVASLTSGTEIGLMFPQGLTIELTEDLVEQIGIDVIRPDLFFPDELILRFSTGTELQTPYTVQYNLGAEWRVGRRGSIETNITQALGYHQILLKDLNPVLRDVDGDPVTDVFGIPQHGDTTTGSIAAFVSEGRSWYSGLDVAWRWRGARHWWSASYTWSKARDLGPDPLKAGIYLPPDSRDVYLEKGLSDTDRRHRLVLSGEFILPLWELRTSGVVHLASEAPVNVTTGRDENMDGITTDRPLGVGRNSGADAPLDDVNAIRAEENLTRAVLGLDPLPMVETLEAPSFAQFDFRIAKRWGMDGGAGGLELFMQVFNLFDRFNGGAIDGRAISVNFGQAITQVGPPRTLELGARVAF